MCPTPSPRERVAAALALQNAPQTAVLLSATQQTPVEAARLRHNAKQATYATAQRQAHYAANPDFDPALTKPVHFGTPPEGLHPAERAKLESELGCLRREAATTARAIDYLEKKLAA